MPEAGIEPARGEPHGILSPGRLPIPPLGLKNSQFIMFFKFYIGLSALSHTGLSQVYSLANI